MKLIGKRIPVEWPPLHVTSSLVVTGGSVVQFFDGTNYYPNREGSPASPILVTHQVDAADPDNGAADVTKSTVFYENDVAISTDDEYTVDGSELLVMKNVEVGSPVEIKARTQVLDNRSGEAYERIDKILLRTMLKAEAQYHVELSQSGRVFFDGYRTPNQATDVSAKVKQGTEEVTDLGSSGIELRWLNSSGEDVMENELYADALSPDWRTLTVDKTYIDKELIRCEAWKGAEMIGYDTVTFIRRFNNVRYEDFIVGLPIEPLTTQIECILNAYDPVGEIDVNSAFLVTWKIKEDGVERDLGTGTPLIVPVSQVNKRASIEVYADVKRREAFAALTGTDEVGEEVLYTDNNDNVLTIETYGL